MTISYLVFCRFVHSLLRNAAESEERSSREKESSMRRSLDIEEEIDEIFRLWWELHNRERVYSKDDEQNDDNDERERE